MLESHPFGENGQEIMCILQEPGELLFSSFSFSFLFFKLAASCSISPY